jgi:hypothetical protein
MVEAADSTTMLKAAAAARGRVLRAYLMVGAYRTVHAEHIRKGGEPMRCVSSRGGDVPVFGEGARSLDPGQRQQSLRYQL